MLRSLTLFRRRHTFTVSDDKLPGSEQAANDQRADLVNPIRCDDCKAYRTDHDDHSCGKAEPHPEPFKLLLTKN